MQLVRHGNQLARGERHVSPSAGYTDPFEVINLLTESLQRRCKVDHGRARVVDAGYGRLSRGAAARPGGAGSRRGTRGDAELCRSLWEATLHSSYGKFSAFH